MWGTRADEFLRKNCEDKGKANCTVHVATLHLIEQDIYRVAVWTHIVSHNVRDKSR